MAESREVDTSISDRLRPLINRWIDPMVERRADSRIAVVLLGLAMLVSLLYCLWEARGTTFSGDELTWVVFSAGMDLKVAFQPHAGHLVVVSHLLYKLVLGTIGPHYIVFRLLTLLTVFASVGLLFAYARSRINPWVALAPCLVLLFFGTDTGHLLQGNGFTIMLSVSCGLLALISLERNTRAGDLIACLALCLGVLTYTVVLPFLAGAIAVVLLRGDRWKRIWIIAIPVLIYLAWRVWLLTNDISSVRGGVDFTNLALLPAWTFQSLSGILSALTGFHLNFASNGSWLPPGEMAGPSLALIFLVAVGWRVARGGLSSWFWVAVVITLALFASQALAWIPGVRDPGTSRYLYPGAFAALLIMIEAVRGLRIPRAGFVAIWLVAICGWASGMVIIHSSGRTLRDRAPGIKTEMTAASLANSATYMPGPGATPLIELVSEAPISIIGPAQRDYGGLALSPDQLAAAPPLTRTKVDSILDKAFGLALLPVGAPPKAADCEEVHGVTGSGNADLPAGGATLESKTGGTVKLRRFGDDFAITVGVLKPGVPMNLKIPEDANQTPWQVSVPANPLLVCPAG